MIRFQAALGGVCGRFNFTKPEEVQARSDFVDWHERRIESRFNIAPSQDILTIVQRPLGAPFAQDAKGGWRSTEPKGEPTAYLSFRETIEQLLLKADAFGLGAELRRAVGADGGLIFLRFAPIELDPDAVADQLLGVLDGAETSRLVIDSIFELERAVVEADGPGRLANYMAALLEALWQQRVTTLALRETQSAVARELSLSADPLSVLAENVVLLQQVTYRAALHRVLSIVKTRSVGHDPTLREFTMQPAFGVRVLAPEESGAEVLVGLAEQRRGLFAEPGREAAADDERPRRPAHRRRARRAERGAAAS